MLGSTIGLYRRKLGLTQEQLAQRLDVTNQAVSKWETDQCCPDVQLLPKLADVLGISMDELFGRPAPEAPPVTIHSLPWEDDGDFHVVVYCGHELLGNSKAVPDCTFTYEGPVRNLYCELNLECGDVQGDVTAGGCVDCGDVGGNLSAGDYAECGDVGGNLSAGDYVECGDVGGSLSAGGYVECGDVAGSVTAGDYVACGDVGQDVTAGNYVECGEIGGEVYAGGPVNCGDHGNTTVHTSNAGVTITIEDGKNKKQKFSFNPFKKDL